jgi:23S rRNA (cytosine1962-C5)-methyltransferase
MQQPFDKFLMFRNRLEKVYRHLSKQARRQGISCYRVYDHDLPEFPFLIEIYGEHLYVSEYKRRHNLDDEAHERWLQECRRAMSDVLGVPDSQIFLRVRQRKAGRLGQYQKLGEAKGEFVVEEAGLKFLVNLTDYLDTGLFLDHRVTRAMVRERSAGKRVLNLFCYTGSFSVYAAAGDAAEVVSVDLSKTYLAWTERNIALNFPEAKNHQAVHADVLPYLKTLPPNHFDIIILDPPTFSNSKRMEDFLDIQKDHVQLLNDCLHTLTPGGLLYFSTNFTKFVLDEKSIRAASVKDITKTTTAFDFTGKLKRPCFLLTK